jgi:hypothetical protein
VSVGEQAGHDSSSNPEEENAVPDRQPLGVWRDYGEFPKSVSKVRFSRAWHRGDREQQDFLGVLNADAARQFNFFLVERATVFECQCALKTDLSHFRCS